MNLRARPLINFSSVLNFHSGKIWVAEQLEIIATRYLNRSARIVARYVRETILDESQNFQLMRPPPAIANGRDEMAFPNLQSWQSTTNAVPYHTNMTEDKIAGAAGTSDPGVKVEEDVYNSNHRG
jgi:hypothetical protein